MHRLLGLAGVVFLLALLVTGIILQHAKDLGLDQSFATSTTFIRWWGIEPPTDAIAFRAGETQVVSLGDSLFANGQSVAQGIGSLKGAVEAGNLILAAGRIHLVVTTADGELVEKSPAPAPVHRVGQAGSQTVIDTDAGMFVADQTFMAWSPRTDADDVVWAEPVSLDPLTIDALQRLYVSQTLTWERVMADLHSGRAFGRYGPLFVDLVAIVMIVLGITGLFLARRPKLLKR